MKSIRAWNLITIGMAAFLFGAAHTIHAEATTDAGLTAEELREKSQDLIEALKGFTVDQRDEAVQKSRDVLATLDVEIRELQGKLDDNWDEMSEKTRDHANDSINELLRLRAEVDVQLERLKHSSIDAWEHIIQGFSNAYRSLYESWEKSDEDVRTERSI